MIFTFTLFLILLFIIFTNLLTSKNHENIAMNLFLVLELIIVIINICISHYLKYDNIGILNVILILLNLVIFLCLSKFDEENL